MSKKDVNSRVFHFLFLTLSHKQTNIYNGKEADMQTDIYIVAGVQLCVHQPCAGVASASGGLWCGL